MTQPVAVRLSDMTFASRAQVLKAHLIDSIAWVTPLVAAGVAMLIPGVIANTALLALIVIGALSVAFIAFLMDYVHFRREGFTKGMDKFRLRSVDPKINNHYITAMHSRYSLGRYLSGRTMVIVFA